MRPPSIPQPISIGKDDTETYIVIKSLYNCLIEHRDSETQRALVTVFMSLPSRKDFPDYYRIIAKPIAMLSIKNKIDKVAYQDVEALLEDFKLMFGNCKFFNEDESQIHKDAVSMENTLANKYEELKNKFNLPPSRTYASPQLSTTTETTITTTTPTTTNITTNSLNTNLSTTTIPFTIVKPTSPTKEDRLGNSLYKKQSNNHSTTSSPKNHVVTEDSIPNTSSKSNNKLKNDNDLQVDNGVNRATQHNKLFNNNEVDNNIHESSPSNQSTDQPIATRKSSIRTHANTTNETKTTSNNVHETLKKPNSQADNDTSNTGYTNGHASANHNAETNVKPNYDHLNDTSMDSISNISADLINSTPIEKCSLNPRRGKNPDAPKRRLLTGYIIYASEIRKEVIEKHPNQNFGDISRLVGNEWKALPKEIRNKYDTRALIHNKRIREKALAEGIDLGPEGGGRSRYRSSSYLSNGGTPHTPKISKRKLARMQRDQMKQFTHPSNWNAGHDDSSSHSSIQAPNHLDPSSPMFQPSNRSHSSMRMQQQYQRRVPTTSSSTQTEVIRFVEPPPRKKIAYSDTFRKYVESLDVPHQDYLAEETVPERHIELPTDWLGAGLGRYKSPVSALKALRDFMLQDAVTMRRNIEPYL